MNDTQAQLAKAPPSQVITLLAGTALSIVGAIMLFGNAGVAPWLFGWLVLLCLFALYYNWRSQAAYKDKLTARGLLFIATFMIGLATMQLGMRLFSFVTYNPIERSASIPYLVASLIALTLLTVILLHPQGAITRTLDTTPGKIALYAGLILIIFFTAWLVDSIVPPL
ncbi:MAG TPA: hypothetical protein VEY08_12525 [Chloroflexia bacterium]|nr:hypothetical protein [Chloroflexia bacterium]